jgi:hypothetical protein
MQLQFLAISNTVQTTLIKSRNQGKSPSWFVEKDKDSMQISKDSSATHEASTAFSSADSVEASAGMSII